MLVYAIYTSIYCLVSGYEMKSKGIKNNFECLLNLSLCIRV